jgi:hypothetical protein
MFHGQVRKLRNIRSVLMFLGPAEEHKRLICESSTFFCSSPLLCAPLPAPRSAHAPATPAPRSLHTGHPGSAPTVLDRPHPPYLDPAPPCLGLASAARSGPACLGRAPPGRACRHRLAPHPVTDARPSEPLRHLVPTPTQPCPTACSSRWPRLTQQRVPAAWPLSASAAPCPTACADRPA